MATGVGTSKCTGYIFYLDTPHTDVINLHCRIVARSSVPGGIPLALFLPEIAHRRRARSCPRLVIGNVDATVREEIATHGNVQDEMELHQTISVYDHINEQWNIQDTFLSKGAILVPDAHGLDPVKPDSCQNPPVGGDTEPITWPSTLKVMPVGNHSTENIWKSEEKEPLDRDLRGMKKNILIIFESRG